MRRIFTLAVGLTLALASPCSALTTVIGGHHVFSNSGESTFPIIATSDSGETLTSIYLFMTMEPAGPIITDVNLIDGTVFESNNNGQLTFEGFPEYQTPGREPGYLMDVYNGSVPTGIVAWVTVDFTGIAPGTYSLSLTNEILGDSMVFNAQYETGGYLDGTVTLIPEPSSLLLGLFAAAALAAFTLRRCRRS